jgi:hypothetical protein
MDKIIKGEPTTEEKIMEDVVKLVYNYFERMDAGELDSTVIKIQGKKVQENGRNALLDQDIATIRQGKRN